MKLWLVRRTLSEQRAEFEFDVDEELAPYFWEVRSLTIAVRGASINTAHASDFFFIALAPLAWMLGVEIETDEHVSQTARLTIDSVGTYLANHYGWCRRVALEGVRTAFRPPPQARRSGLMFSGGVDSLSAFCEVGASIDTLIHLTNFDRLLSGISIEQHNTDLGDMDCFAKNNCKSIIAIETNIADVFRHARFDCFFPSSCSFWYGLQHVNHIAAAVSVLQGLDRIYLSGSFDKLHERVGSCAARSQFVNRYTPHASLHLVQERMLRQRKVELILDRHPEYLAPLRVCYLSGDRTCHKCEKCLGTAMMIVAGGGEIARTSFPAGTKRALRDRLRHLKNAPIDHSLLTEQALTGRLLRGNRMKRFDALEALLR